MVICVHGDSTDGGSGVWDTLVSLSYAIEQAGECFNDVSRAIVLFCVSSRWARLASHFRLPVVGVVRAGENETIPELRPGRVQQQFVTI